jgi:hypothetical protein
MPKTSSGFERTVRLIGTETRSKHFEWQQSGILNNGRKSDSAMSQPDEGIGRKRSNLKNSMRGFKGEVLFNVGASKRGQTDRARQFLWNWV